MLRVFNRGTIILRFRAKEGYIYIYIYQEKEMELKLNGIALNRSRNHTEDK